MSWSKMNENKQKRGKYVKFGDDGTIRGVVRGDPYEFMSVYEDGGSRELKPDEDHPKARSRFKVNFSICIDGEWLPKILEQGPKVGDKLAAYWNEFEDEFHNKIFKIIRTGSGLKTDYDVLFVGDLKPEERAKIDELPMFALSGEEATSFDPEDM